MDRSPVSICQEWVTKLPLRYQGCLVSAVRGYDGGVKEDPSKYVTRCLRNFVLRPHVGDVNQAKSFFMPNLSLTELDGYLTDLTRNFDHYPVHFILHLIHAVEVIGYKHPTLEVAAVWRVFYLTMCKKMHVNPETPGELAKRLEADEEVFGQNL